MITTRIRIQLILFVIIAAVGVTYLGVNYVGLDRYIRDNGIEAKLELPEAGGIFANAEVTYRGVPVGRVGSLDLTSDGVVARLDIDEDAPPIPADVAAVVANRSAIGEQYVDLRPDSEDGPYLEDGSVIVGSEASLPPKVDNLLRNSRNFFESVPTDDLRTVVDELYDLTRDSHDPLRKLLETSGDLAITADKNFAATSSLIDSSATVLATQEASAQSIRAFSSNLRLFSTTLKSSDRDLSRLLAVAPDAAEEIDALFTRVGQPLGVVLGNLISTARVFGTNSKGVRSVMIQLPKVIDVGYNAIGPDGLRVALVNNFYAPLPCTAGYEGTELRQGLDTSNGEPLNVGAGCSAPPATGINVRGAQNAPAPEAALSSGLSVTSPTKLADLMGGSS